MIRFQAILFSLVFASAINAGGEPEKQAMPFVESLMGLKMASFSVNDIADPGSVALLVLALESTTEHHAHNMNGAKGNQVVTFSDGREGVYDASGELVTDCVNQGSFNYFDRVKEPLKHFVADRLPWIWMGNCREDPTTASQRLDAYLEDFIPAVNRALEIERDAGSITEKDWDADGQLLGLAILEKIVRSAPEGELTPPDPSDSEAVAEYLAALRAAFRKSLINE